MATKPTTKKTTTVKKARANKETPEGAVRLAGTAKTSKRATRLAAKPPCRIAKCKRTYRAKGYCVHHYALWRHNEYGNGRYKQCGDTSCPKPMMKNGHGYCEEHFTNYYVKGQAVAKAAPAAAAAPAAEKKTA